MGKIANSKLYQNNLQLTTKQRIFSHLSGEHSSIFSGNGLDFRELREYNTSDDIRHLNWKVTARTGTPCVNVFSEDKKLNIVVVYLISGSIYFGSVREKSEVMEEIFGSLCLSATEKKDTLTTLFFSDKEERFFPPMKQNTLKKEAITYAQTLNPLGKKVDFEKLSNYLLGAVKSKSLLFLIGDFLELPNLKLLNAKYELYIAIVRDKFEEDLKLLGECGLVNPSSGEQKHFFLNSENIATYNKNLKSHDEKLFTHLKSHKIRHTKIYTDDDIGIKLRELVR
jgi:uncharacterized protein (DUF58 family)